MSRLLDLLGLCWEVAYPWVLSVAATVLVLRVPSLAAILYRPTADMLSAGLTIASIFIGFVATVASILMSINGRAVEFMREIDRLKDVIGYLNQSIRTSFVFVILSLVMVFMKDFKGQWYHGYWGIAWFFLACASILITYRGTVITMVLMHRAASNK